MSPRGCSCSVAWRKTVVENTVERGMSLLTNEITMSGSATGRVAMAGGRIGIWREAMKAVNSLFELGSVCGWLVAKLVAF